MTKLLLINEAILAIIWAVGIFILVHLIYSKNGYFRKLMIAYFIVEVYIFFGLGIFLLINPDAKIVNMLYVFTIPKAVLKIFFYHWLKKGK